MYADDTALFYSDSSVSAIQNTLQHTLGKINNWLQKKKLSLNKEKTKTLLFGSHRKRIGAADLEVPNFFLNF